MNKTQTPHKAQDADPGYEIIEYKGEPARLYPDGAIRDEKGYFLEQHPGANIFDSEGGRQAALKRWDRKRAEFARGVVEGAHLPENAGSAEAWQKIAAHATKVFLDTDNARGLAELGRFIAEHSGFAPSRTNVQATQTNINIGASTSDILVAMQSNPTLAPFARALLQAASRALRVREERSKDE